VGRVDYSKFIAGLSQELNIANRVIELYPNGFDYKKYPNINKKIVAWKKLDEFDVKTNIF